MSRRVNRQYIDDWVNDHYPNAITKLSNACGVPANSIMRIRTGRVPKDPSTRIRMAVALGVQEDDLFPPVSAGAGEAS